MALRPEEHPMTITYVADYYPYGKILREWAPCEPERFLTTQHERDSESGYDNRGARLYDADVGRFLSVDPLAQEFAGWSGYNYVLGNPVRLVDPDGRSPVGDIYNLNGVHIGNDGQDDNQVYLRYTSDNTQLSQSDSRSVTQSANNGQEGGSVLTLNVTAILGLTGEELNLRASLAVLKQAEAGRLNPPLEYNAWNSGDNFTEDSYESNPEAYSDHPGINSNSGGTASGAYQALERYFNATDQTDFSPVSQDQFAVGNMTSASYAAAISGNVSEFKDATTARWTSLKYWTTEQLQPVFNAAVVAELTGKSKVAAPVGSLLRE